MKKLHHYIVSYTDGLKVGHKEFTVSEQVKPGAITKNLEMVIDDESVKNAVILSVFHDVIDQTVNSKGKSNLKFC